VAKDVRQCVSKTMAQFSADELEELARADEVEIETRRAAGGSRRTIIWIVVDGGHVYVRSVRGPAGAGIKRSAEMARHACTPGRAPGGCKPGR
jgi:hypothetical protein